VKILPFRGYLRQYRGEGRCVLSERSSAVRVSNFYSLGVSQPSLEFLDVDIRRDTKVFVDPHAFTYLSTDWGRECVSLLQDFYGEVMEAIRANDRKRGRYLLARLGESNEAHLGLSLADSGGSGVAEILADEIFDALSTSRAVTTGLLTDVQETVLFVPGVGHDRVSDMTINIVRKPLIEFTHRMCALYEIEVIDDVDSGPMWNRHSHSWEAELVPMPMPNSKLLLIPKGVVRKTSTFDPGEYLTHFVLPYLQQVELSKPSSRLVQTRTSRKRRGERFVTKKSIREENKKPTKELNTEATEANPALLDAYRQSKSGQTEPPDHEEIAAITATPMPDWDQLLADVLAIPSGPAHADTYHRAVMHLLTALFYPALDMPLREVNIHQGRKRIDIVYTNVSESGFFHWLNNAGDVPCGLVVVECKNYTGALANPELDQLTSRFSTRRGKFGLLCYRGFRDKKATVVQRCRDAALDDRGAVIALDDDDLGILVESRKDGELTLFKYLMQRYQELI